MEEEEGQSDDNIRWTSNRLVQTSLLLVLILSNQSVTEYF